jgi:hypothetical protein
MQKVKLPSNKKAQSKPKVTNKAPKKVNKTSNKKDLNDKQKLFALEFSKDINATRAYKAVY